MTTPFPVTYGSSDILAINKLINVGNIRVNGSGGPPKDQTPTPPPAEADQPAPVGHNSKGAQMPKDESGKAPSWATPSKLSLDEAAKASIGTGRYVQERRVLLEAVSDPRMGIAPLPLMLLAAVIEHINGGSGVAFPKVSTLAQEIVKELNGLPAHYRGPALDNAATIVRQCGYVVTERRAPRGGGHAITHYAITYPSPEEKAAGIEAWRRWKRGEEPAPDLIRGMRSANLTDGVGSGADLIRGMRSEGADLTRRRDLTSSVDRESGGATHYTEPVNINPKSLSCADAPGADASLSSDEALSEGAPLPSTGSPCKPSKADIDAALADYVEAAKRCGLPVPRKPAAYLDAVAVRLREGSLDEWREMLAIVERSPHLLGENDRVWKADLAWLVERKNYAKVLDGRYLRNKPKPKPMSRY